MSKTEIPNLVKNAYVGYASIVLATKELVLMVKQMLQPTIRLNMYVNGSMPGKEHLKEWKPRFIWELRVITVLKKVLAPGGFC